MLFFPYAESDLDDLSHDIQSPEPELLYYRGPEDQESILHEDGGDTEEVAVTSWGMGAAQDWCASFTFSFTQTTLLICETES